MTVFSVCAVALFIGLLPDGALAASNAQSAAPDTEYSFSIGPGGSYSNVSTLQCEAPCDFDIYHMTITAATSVRIRILDCCILGDNICLARPPGTIVECAASPDFVDVTTPVLQPGTYDFYVGYRPPTPGGFPAGYDISVTA
jgi:hypothetical protein